jgi:hypothetical protein
MINLVITTVVKNRQGSNGEKRGNKRIAIYCFEVKNKTTEI